MDTYFAAHTERYDAYIPTLTATYCHARAAMRVLRCARCDARTAISVTSANHANHLRNAEQVKQAPRRFAGSRTGSAYPWPN